MNGLIFKYLNNRYYIILYYIISSLTLNTGDLLHVNLTYTSNGGNHNVGQDITTQLILY